MNENIFNPNYGVEKPAETASLPPIVSLKESISITTLARLYSKISIYLSLISLKKVNSLP